MRHLREPSPSPPRSVSETQIKYVSLPHPRSYSFTDIFGFSPSSPGQSSPPPRLYQWLSQFQQEVAKLFLSPGSFWAGEMTPSTWAGSCTYFGGGCGACCPPSLRLHIPARSTHVCGICLVSPWGTPPGDAMGELWARS